MADDDDIKIISRVKPPDKGGGDDDVKFVSRAKPKDDAADKERQDALGFWQHQKQNAGQAQKQMGEGGGFNRAMGALGYLASPLRSAGQAVLGDSARQGLRWMGAPPSWGQYAENAAGAAGEMAGPSAMAGVAKAAPQMAEAAAPLLNKAAPVLGKVARGGMDSIEDIISSRLGKAGAKAEPAPQPQMGPRKPPPAPTQGDIKADATALFKQASDIGANVKPEAFASMVDGVPAVLKSEKITSGNIPMSDKIYTQTKDLVDRLEAYRGHELTLENLQSLQQEANGFVKKAMVAAEGDKGASDVRGATIVAKQIRDFVDNLKPEQVNSGNPEQAVATLNRAKELWRRQAKMDDVKNIIDVSKRLKDPDYLQQQFRGLVKDPLASKNYTPQEQKLIDEIAADTRTEKLVHVIPRGDKATKAVEALRMENTGRMKKAEELVDLIARGGSAPDKPGVAAKTGGLVKSTANAAGDLGARGATGIAELINNLLRKQPPQ